MARWLDIGEKHRRPLEFHASIDDFSVAEAGEAGPSRPRHRASGHGFPVLTGQPTSTGVPSRASQRSTIARSSGVRVAARP